MIENVRLAFTGILSHKLRSFLTMLGIIIGIAAIIAIVSTIRGTSEKIKEDLIGSGNNTVDITLYYGDSEYEPDGWITTETGPPLLNMAQKNQVLSVDHVANATFYYSTTSVYNIYYGSKAFSGGTVIGIDQNYLKTTGYVVRQGRSFAQRDFDGNRKVLLLDSNAAENLFPGEDPVGKIVEINADAFMVVGVVQQRDAFMPKIATYDDYEMNYSSVMGSLIVPYTVWPIIGGFDVSQNLIIKADSTDTMSQAGSDVAKLLNSFIASQFGTNTNSRSSGSKYEYRADNIMERIRSMQQLSESTSSQLILIAGISLLVGGIGVANIMLVSVTERTGEIGLKKAIGAKKRVILAQFLTEATVLTGIGGIIGVVCGIVLAELMARFGNTPTAIDVSAIVLAVATSTVIGVLSGLIPSFKAANLDPIEALRSE